MVTGVRHAASTTGRTRLGKPAPDPTGFTSAPSMHCWFHRHIGWGCSPNRGTPIPLAPFLEDSMGNVKGKIANYLKTALFAAASVGTVDPAMAQTRSSVVKNIVL